ncbi:hypothetical protein ACOMHN_045962 [Nucella lapillus]
MEIFNKLSSDTSFRFINSNQRFLARPESWLAQHASPRFDMCKLARKDRKGVVKELSNLLGEDECYKDFIQSERYKELRLSVANKIWATESQTRLNVGSKNNATKDTILNKAVSNLKIRIGVPGSESHMGESHLCMDESFVPSSILKEGGNQGEDGSASGGHMVRFSSASSLVIFPTSSASRTSGSFTTQDGNRVV